MTKRYLQIVLALCMVLSIFPGALPAQAESRTVYVRSNTLKVYAKPDTSASALGTMAYGERMQLLATSGDWARVRNASGDTGYCKCGGLTTANPNKYDEKVYITESGVPVYRRPGTGASVLMKLKKGDSYTAVARTEDGKWARLKNGGTYGYVQMKYLSTQPQKEEEHNLNQKVYIRSNNLKVYAKASTSASVLGSLSFGESLTLMAVQGDWARVSNSAGEVGYCKRDGLTKTNPNGAGATFYAQEKGVKVYRDASTASDVLMKLSLNAKVSAVAISENGNWLRLYNAEHYGYVQAKYMDADPVKEASQKSTADKLTELARSLKGTPYVYAGQSPSEGFDCSGFTRYVYQKAAGVGLKRTSKTQGYDEKYAKIENPSHLKPGDLLFFDTVSGDDDLCDHVGIYLGGNQFIHASSGAGEVTISALGSSDSSYYFRTFSWGRRILG